MKQLCLFITIFLCLQISFAQNVWTVDNNSVSGAQFTSLQVAIDAASPGDFIYVHPSPNDYGSITINKTIHLRGIGHNPELNSGELATMTNVNINTSSGAPNSSIQGLQFSSLIAQGSNDYSGVQIMNNRITSGIYGGPNGSSNNWLIQGNAITANSTALIEANDNLNWIIVNNYIQNAAASESWVTFKELNSSTELRNNIIVSNANSSSPWIYQDCSSLQAENNIYVFRNAAAAALGGSNYSVTHINCLIYNINGTVMSGLSGSNNLANENPLFLENPGNFNYSSSGDYRLDESSIAYQYGTDGQDLGIYGNSFNFDMRGYSLDLPYPTGMTINTTTVPNGGVLEVEFNAKGN